MITIGSVVRVAYDFAGEPQNEELRNFYFSVIRKLAKDHLNLIQFYIYR